MARKSTLLSHGEMMKKEKEESIPKDSFIAEWMSEPTKIKERDTNLQLLSKTENH